MKISDNTAISMPMRNLIALIMAIGIGIFAYSDLTQRITQLETARQLMEADLLKKADQTPVNQELYMLIEFLSGQFETMEKEIQFIESNNINITFLKDQVEEMQNNIELLKVSLDTQKKQWISYCELLVKVLKKDKNLMSLKLKELRKTYDRVL